MALTIKANKCCYFCDNNLPVGAAIPVFKVQYLLKLCGRCPRDSRGAHACGTTQVCPCGERTKHETKTNETRDENKGVIVVFYCLVTQQRFNGNHKKSNARQ